MTTAEVLWGAWTKSSGLSRLAGTLMAASLAFLIPALLGLSIERFPYLVGLLQLGTMGVLLWLFTLMVKRRLVRSRTTRHAVLIFKRPHWFLVSVLAGSTIVMVLQLSSVMTTFGPHSVVCEEGTCTLAREGLPLRVLTVEEVDHLNALMLSLFSSAWLFANTLAVLGDSLLRRSSPCLHSPGQGPSE